RVGGLADPGNAAREPVGNDVGSGSDIGRHQRRLRAERGEDFTGGSGEEFLNTSVLENGPLCMGSGKTDGVTALSQDRFQLQGAQQLSLFPAHEIRRAERIAARNPRNDVNSAAAQLDTASGNLLRRERAGKVGRLYPAEARADHAA